MSRLWLLGFGFSNQPFLVFLSSPKPSNRSSTAKMTGIYPLFNIAGNASILAVLKISNKFWAKLARTPRGGSEGTFATSGVAGTLRLVLVARPQRVVGLWWGPDGDGKNPTVTGGFRGVSKTEVSQHVFPNRFQNVKTHVENWWRTKSSPNLKPHWWQGRAANLRTLNWSKRWKAPAEVVRLWSTNLFFRLAVGNLMEQSETGCPRDAWNLSSQGNLRTSGRIVASFPWLAKKNGIYMNLLFYYINWICASINFGGKKERTGWWLVLPFEKYDTHFKIIPLSMENKTCWQPPTTIWSTHFCNFCDPKFWPS